MVVAPRKGGGLRVKMPASQAIERVGAIIGTRVYRKAGTVVDGLRVVLVEDHDGLIVSTGTCVLSALCSWRILDGSGCLVECWETGGPRQVDGVVGGGDGGEARRAVVRPESGVGRNSWCLSYSAHLSWRPGEGLAVVDGCADRWWLSGTNRAWCCWVRGFEPTPHDVGFVNGEVGEVAAVLRSWYG